MAAAYSHLDTQVLAKNSMTYGRWALSSEMDAYGCLAIDGDTQPISGAP
jgi:hypothetical protein